MHKANIVSTKKKNCKPFLRWAGGKSWLLKHLDDFLPKNDINSYYEPFVGSGAVFFYSAFDKDSFLSDLNHELIETYNCVKEDVENVLSYLDQFKNSKEDYYKIRKTKFKLKSQRAARFIYLNKTSFNGIYRVNSKGEYNVPYGFRTNLSIDIENLRKASEALVKAEINVKDFEESIQKVQPNDLVFLDPPYTVTHNNNGFINYNQKLFSIKDQHRLAKSLNQIKESGAYYILTNAAHSEVRRIFNNGDSVMEISRNSVIGGRGAKRGKYNELVISNII